MRMPEKKSTRSGRNCAQELGRVTRRWLAGLGASASMATLAAPADAQMVGGEVVSGNATVTQTQTATGTHTHIETTTHRTKMRWDSHDVYRGDSLRIQQPTRNSAYLAQVNDARITTIDGLLSSNGQVWIANPAGVYFGGNAVVDVARLVAGAGTISDRDFARGIQRFSNLRGVVRNEGRIMADGGVTLLGQSVSNHGTIISRRGDIVMAAGDDVWVTRHDTHIEVHVPDARDTSAPAVENTGTLIAGNRGRARLAAGDFLGVAIRNSGYIDARRIALEGGTGGTVEVSGVLDASAGPDGNGGQVTIEGDAILLDDVLVDVSGSGDGQGGEVLVGGELAGGDGAADAMKTARAVVMTDSAEIRADGGETGIGGDVVLWSDELTIAEGRISARGGSEAGDGGFVETSSKGRLVADADVDVSAPAGEVGEWLLDPIDVRIVDTIQPDQLELTEAAVPFQTIFAFLPEIGASQLPTDPSFITAGSIVDALIRGGLVRITTETPFLTLAVPDLDRGNIWVEAAIEVPVDAPIRPNQASFLELDAANSIFVEQRIASDNANLALAVTLLSNVQPELDSQRTNGTVQIGQLPENPGDPVDPVEIKTNGGFLVAQGAKIVVTETATIDTTNADPERIGGTVDFDAVDPDTSDSELATIEIAGDIVARSGAVNLTGDKLELTGTIDSLSDLATQDAPLGGVLALFGGDVDIQGDISSDSIELQAGLDGVGDLRIGVDEMGVETPVTLRADSISLLADTLDVEGESDPGDGRIDLGSDVRFRGVGRNEENATNAPSRFEFAQDARIVDADLPAADRFGDAPGGNVEGMIYRIATLGIDSDGVTQEDLILSDPTKFQGSILEMQVPETIRVDQELNPRSVGLTVTEGFTVTADLASKLRPQDPNGDATLFIHAGAGGTDTVDGVEQSNLWFDTTAQSLFIADNIIFQAGLPGAITSDGLAIIGNTQEVFAENAMAKFLPTQSFEIIQDATIDADNIPLAEQFQDTGPSLLPQLDYTLRAEGGSIEIGSIVDVDGVDTQVLTQQDADKLNGTALTLIALGPDGNPIEVYEGALLDEMDPDAGRVELRVEQAELGGYADFLVTQELLDRVVIAPAGGGDRILTLRAEAEPVPAASQIGALLFGARDEDGAAIPGLVRVEAERILLAGRDIDFDGLSADTAPIFQSDDFTSPRRLIIDNVDPTPGASVANSFMPTEENFPDGLGPSELLAVRSSNSISLRQAGLQFDPTPGAETGRFWQFPVQDTTRVILTAPNVRVDRGDGYNVVLGAYDDVWGTNIEFSSLLEGGNRPIGFGAVDAGNINSVRGFDADFDFLNLDLSDPNDFDKPEDADGEAILASTFQITQDASFLLRSTDDILRLPDFDDGDTADGEIDFQPDTYQLRTTLGVIEIENDVLEATNLRLQVDAPGVEVPVTFDNETLVVESLLIESGEGLRIENAVVEADESITFASDVIEGSEEAGTDLSFGTGVFLTARDFLLKGGLGGGERPAGGGSAAQGISLAVVDARTNAPSFTFRDEGSFALEQGGAILNGATLGANFESETLGMIPALSQFSFLDTGANAEFSSYSLFSRLRGIEINDPTEVLLGRSVSFLSALPIIMRADPQTSGFCFAEALCGNGTVSDLVLIPDVAPGNEHLQVESVSLAGASISLDAPEGQVIVGSRQVLEDAGGNPIPGARDPRVQFEIGTGGIFAIRQRDPIDSTTAPYLPDQVQITVPQDVDPDTGLPTGLRFVPYQIQALEGLELGSDLADRVRGTDLILTAGVPGDDLDASFGGIRGRVVLDEDGNQIPYDRFADLDGNGIIDGFDQLLLDDLNAVFSPQLAINEPGVAFDLLLRTLTLQSEPDDDVPIQLGSVTIETESDQIIEDDVELVGDAPDGQGGFLPAVLSARAGLLDLLNPLETAIGSSIAFLEDVYASTGRESLVVEATNRVRFAKNVGLGPTGADGERLDTLTINLQQLPQLEEAPPVPRAEFGDEESADPVFVRAREVRLNTQEEALFAREDIPSSATFFRRGGDLVFEIGTNDGTGRISDGVFTMGRNEKLSVAGENLRILAKDGTVTIGDLSAEDFIEVDAARIQMRRRGGGPVVRSNGRQRGDTGVDYVADTIRFHDDDVDHSSRDLHGWQVGRGRDAKFGISDIFDAPSFMDDFSVVSLQFNILLSDSIDSAGNRLVLDGIPDGISRQFIAQTYADRNPDVPIAVPAAYRVPQPEALRDVSIEVRNPTPAELQAAADGAAVFYDLNSVQGSGDGAELRVAETRIVAEEIERALALRERVFGKDWQRTDQVREILQRAVDDYRRSTGARRVVGFELRRYVYNRPSSQFAAYQELQTLDALFRHHRRSGLTPAEYRSVQRKWLEKIKPEGISVQELAEFVHPSRYVRGSDVLDVFGD